MPSLSSYIDPANSFHRRIAFSAPQKDPSSDVYQIIVSIEKQIMNRIPKANEFDVCLNVAKSSK